MKILTVVAAALMDSEGKVLLAKRPDGKQLADHFEFPGGKIEPGELPEDALIRELKEELGIDVKKVDLQPLTFLSHSYPEFGFHLLMPTWLITQWNGVPRALEHKEIRFVHPNDMHDLLMIEADRPLVNQLMVVASTREA